jgi:hypothetical protein
MGLGLVMFGYHGRLQVHIECPVLVYPCMYMGWGNMCIIVAIAGPLYHEVKRFGF